MQKKVIECKVREKSMKKKITIAVVILVIIAIGAATGYHFYSKRFIYNKEGDLGNTTGNLYNEGLFCTY